MLDQYTSSKLQRDTGTVFDAAKKKPVEIRRQGDIDYIMMTRKEYQKLIALAERGKR